MRAHVPCAALAIGVLILLPQDVGWAQRPRPAGSPPQPAASAPFAVPAFKVQELYIVTAQPRLYFPGPVHIQVGTSMTVGPQANGMWNTFDLKPWGIPADARAVFLAGLLIITHGTRQEIANMDVAFRQPGDATATCGAKIGQAVEAHVGGGQRQTMSVWVPVRDGLLDMCVTRSTTGQWPATSSYAASFTVQAWAK